MTVIHVNGADIINPKACIYVTNTLSGNVNTRPRMYKYCC